MRDQVSCLLACLNAAEKQVINRTCADLSSLTDLSFMQTLLKVNSSCHHSVI